MHSNKGIISVVIGLGILLMAGFAALGYGFFKRTSNPDFSFFERNEIKTSVTQRNNSPLPGSVKMLIPAGTNVKNIETTTTNIVVHLVDQQGRTSLLILDGATGAFIRRIEFSVGP